VDKHDLSSITACDLGCTGDFAPDEIG
jgi:hypothetical protein